MGSIQVKVAGETWSLDFPDTPSLPNVRPSRGASRTITFAEPASNKIYWNPTTGSDSNDGLSPSAPKKSLAACVAKGSGWTTLLQAGDHEVGSQLPSANPTADERTQLLYQPVVIPAGHTVQPAAGARPRIFGSRAVTSAWTASADGKSWSTPFAGLMDRSPTDKYAQPDNGTDPNNPAITAGWRFIDTVNAPMAGASEGVYIKDPTSTSAETEFIRLRQVRTLAEVGPGKFFVEGTAVGPNALHFQSTKYHIGDNPAGREVRIVTRSTVACLNGVGATWQGIDILQYGNTGWMGGVLKFNGGGGGAKIRHTRIMDNATRGLGGYRSANCSLENVTILRAGNLGVALHQCDDFTIKNSVIEEANWEDFHFAPVSGGIKVTASRRVKVVNCSISKNNTKSVWADVSVLDLQIINSNCDDNEQFGVVWEIGCKGLFLNSTACGNKLDGLLIADTGRVKVKNSVIFDNCKGGSGNRNLKVVEDGRRPLTNPYGQDERFTVYNADGSVKTPDPDMEGWYSNHIVVENTLQGGSGQQFAGFAYESYQKNVGASRPWTDTDLTLRGNLYVRTVANAPLWLVLLPGSGSAQNLYTSSAGGGQTAFANFKASTGLEAGSALVDGTSYVSGRAPVQSAVNALVASGQLVLQPLTQEEANLIGRPDLVGTKQLGLLFN